MVVEGAVPVWLIGPVSVKVPCPRFFVIAMVPPAPAETPVMLTSSTSQPYSGPPIEIPA